MLHEGHIGTFHFRARDTRIESAGHVRRYFRVHYPSRSVGCRRLAGIFAPAGAAKGDLSVGSLVATVGDAEVRSPWAGALMGMLAVEGERVQVGQPIAWLRSA